MRAAQGLSIHPHGWIFRGDINRRSRAAAAFVYIKRAIRSWFEDDGISPVRGIQSLLELSGACHRSGCTGSLAYGGRRSGRRWNGADRARIGRAWFSRPARRRQRRFRHRIWREITQPALRVEVAEGIQIIFVLRCQGIDPNAARPSMGFHCKNRKKYKILCAFHINYPCRMRPAR